jgi:glycosyltransferase involved in cell wall biosynthesis
MKALLQEPGIIDRGFVTPDKLPAVIASSSAFILPSVKEPWGVVLAEAMGCGLPAIATQACGAAIDLIRDPYNGRIIAPGCERQLADAMVDLHQRQDDLAILGSRAAEAAEPFKSVYWSQRLISLIRRELQRN